MADIRPFLLKPSDSLAEAMARVSTNGEGFAAVADPKRNLVGTFCDRDGRLAMLRGVSLDVAVEDVMAPELTKLARLPGKLVLDNGVVVDVVPRDRAPVDAMVMAGGKGTRLRAVTGTVPKPLLSLGRSTIVERILGRLGKAGVNDVFLSLNYRAGQFKKRIGDGSAVGVSVKYVEEPAPLGTAGALSLLPAKGADLVFVSNADLITSVDYARLFDFHRSQGGSVTMAAATVTTHVKFGVVHAKRSGLLERMEEKPQLQFFCNAGMYVLDRSVLELVPKDTFFPMTELLDAVRAAGGDVHVFPMWEKWVDAGSPEEFQQVLIDFATGEQT